MSGFTLQVGFVLVALAALAGAITLEAIGHDATQAWVAFSAALSLAVGQHLPAPDSAGKAKG